MSKIRTPKIYKIINCLCKTVLILTFIIPIIYVIIVCLPPNDDDKYVMWALPGCVFLFWLLVVPMQSYAWRTLAYFFCPDKTSQGKCIDVLKLLSIVVTAAYFLWWPLWIMLCRSIFSKNLIMADGGIIYGIEIWGIILAVFCALQIGIFICRTVLKSKANKKH